MLSKYDFWKALQDAEIPTGEYCTYCQDHIYKGDIILRSSEATVHKECFDDYIYETLEFKEEIAE